MHLLAQMKIIWGALIFCLTLGPVTAQERPFDLKWREKICNKENIQNCLPIYRNLTLRDMPIQNIKMVQLPEQDLRELCERGTCQKLTLRDTRELVDAYLKAHNRPKSDTPLSPAAEARRKQLEEEAKEEAEETAEEAAEEKAKEDRKKGAHFVMRAAGGTGAYEWIGSAEDMPRTALFGLGGGIIFCSGKCEAYLDIVAGVGGRDKFVETRYAELSGKVTFMWMPITIKDRVKMGIGADFALTRGVLTNTYLDSVTVSDNISMSLGIDLNVEARLLEISRGAKKKPIDVSLGLNGRFYLQDMLKSCSRYSDNKIKADSICYGAEQLKSLEQGPVTGGGVDTFLYLKAVWR